ncbi:MAG TPA: biopolymer transporter ExbD [Terracidiphilus sp.]|jgi:biopolymer transport protein ExbD
MTATTGNGKGLASEINVTPMIDVLLVLLIIFMIIVPAVPRGEAALAPRSSHQEGHSNAVVLEVEQGAAGVVSLRINQQPVAPGELPSRLAAIYANRADRVLFLKGDGRLSFTQIAEVIDIGHAAGIDRIALITPGVVAEK